MGSGWNVLAGHKGAGSPEFQKLRKKNLVTSALSWFKVLRATSMNQKFPYILRISEKAKHVRFQVSVEKGLEIVVPKRFSASRVPLLVEKNSQWIERAFQKAKAFQGLIGPVPVWPAAHRLAGTRQQSRLRGHCGQRRKPLPDAQ